MNGITIRSHGSAKDGSGLVESLGKDVPEISNSCYAALLG